jgi:hypothetical protein
MGMQSPENVDAVAAVASPDSADDDPLFDRQIAAYLRSAVDAFVQQGSQTRRTVPQPTRAALPRSQPIRVRR